MKDIMQKKIKTIRVWDPLDGSRKVWVTAVAAVPSTSHQRGAAG